MERKIGEIFEYNGEWYQCFVGNYCKSCAFNERKCYSIVENGDPIGECCADRRKDNKDVFFKKLEKVGEPYISSRNKKRYQLYRCFCLPIITKDRRIEIGDANWVGIEIKQNKEDMEENKLNLKPFDLQKAREGKPVCTRDGRKARIICFDAKRKDEKSIIALVPSNDYPGFEDLIAYHNNGNYHGGHENDGDLMMLPEKKEGWANVYDDTPIYDTEEEALNRRSKIRGYIDTVKVSWEE